MTHHRRDIGIVVSEQEHATILTALRLYGEYIKRDPAYRSHELDQIATNAGKFEALDAENLELLCEHLNIERVPEPLEHGL